MGRGKNYGEPTRYDPTFNGPIHNRSCTDIFWLILFIVFLGAWGFVGYYGMKNGNINKLLAPVDSKGRRCGLDAGLENKTYLVFFNIEKCLSPSAPLTGCPTPQVCVKECPDKTILFKEMLQQDFDQYKHSMVCIEDIDFNKITLDNALALINNNTCASYVIKSQPVLQRCFLNITEALAEITAIKDQFPDEDTLYKQLSELLRINQLSGQIIQDLVQSRYYLLGALGGVIILCFVYILLLRWVVGPVVWSSIACLIGLLGFSLYLCYNNYIYYRDNALLYPTTNVKGYFQNMLTQKETWMVFLVGVAIILVILLLIVIFLRTRINIAIALIREGSKAVTAIKSTIFFPIIPWILQCFVIAYGVLVLMYLMSMGEKVFQVMNLSVDTSCSCSSVIGNIYKDREPCDPLSFLAECKNTVDGGLCNNATCHFTGLDSPLSVVWLHLINLLVFFWTMFFIGGVSDMMLASTFSTWYWTYDKKEVPFFTLSSGVFRTLRFHTGTVAFGALIIAIVRVIRVILEYIDQKIKKFDNPFTRCIMCFCKCFCWCLENFLKFINKNAYIMCAVHGHNFCKSARDAFSLLMRNIIRVVVLDKVTDFLFFLSKLLISIGVGFAVFYLLESNVMYNITKSEPLNYNYIPAVILSLATYLICTVFFKVYEMAVDTLFLCFLEDCERNDGSPEKPYFMSKNLMRILGKKNKKIN